MKAFLIALDLKNDQMFYESLYEYIKKHPWINAPNPRTWVITSTTNDASVIRDKIEKFLWMDDQVMVVGLDGDWATHGLNENITSWMKRRVVKPNDAQDEG